MDIYGKQLIAAELLGNSDVLFQSVNPATGESFGVPFHEATLDEVDRAGWLADEAYNTLRTAPASQREALLFAIADEFMALGDVLLERAHAETGLPMGRLNGERNRAVNQIKLFARLVGEGSWVDARIDQGDPERTPFPKPDVRSMLTGIGPVAVFGASNFPLAIGVAGTDTIAALGAGCPVVAKAHPGHPGTCELLGRAIQQAVNKTGLPPGCFSMIQGKSYEAGIALVRHKAIKAVAFTGSLQGGRALFDAAASREDPIPVYAEMGSTNPVFILPGAMKARGKEIAAGYINSVNLGVGQFCTNPGIVCSLEGDGLDGFKQEAATLAAAVEPATMLHAGIFDGYTSGVANLQAKKGITLVDAALTAAGEGANQAKCVLFETRFDVLNEASDLLEEEVFGPASLIVSCASTGEMETLAEKLEGHLTATIHGTEEDLAENQALLRILEKKVGRVIFNGFPTGIEVCAAMHHGGPYPATTDSHYTSIGTGAILRFGRPICYQNFPQSALPEPLRDANTAGIWRLVDDVLTKDNIRT